MSFIFKKGYNGFQLPLREIQKFSNRKRLFKIFNKDKDYQTYITYWNPHIEYVYNPALKMALPVEYDYSERSYRYSKKDLINEANDLYSHYPDHNVHLNNEINNYLNKSKGLILDISEDMGNTAFEELVNLMETDLNKKIKELHWDFRR